MFKQLLVESLVPKMIVEDEEEVPVISKHTILSGTSKSELVEQFLYELKTFYEYDIQQS